MEDEKKLIYMKRFLLIFTGMWMLIFVSCSNKEEVYRKSVSQNDTITYYNTKGSINMDRLSKFTENVEKKKKDRINLIEHTVEGDPIITQLYFNEKDIEISIDKSKDKFAGQDKDKILYHTIKGSKTMKEDLFKYLENNGF